LKEVGKGFREKGEEGEKAQRASSGTQILKSGAEEIDLLHIDQMDLSNAACNTPAQFLENN